MRDKLAGVIGDASEGAGPLKVRRLPIEACQHIADATLEWLREYLGSDEVVDRATLAAANWDQTRMDMPTLGSVDEFRRDTDRAFYTGQIRAALSSIMEQSDGR